MGLTNRTQSFKAQTVARTTAAACHLHSADTPWSGDQTMRNLVLLIETEPKVVAERTRLQADADY